MRLNQPEERASYRGSGRVAWVRFVPTALLALLAAAGMAYCWFAAFHAGWGYWLVTPVVMALPVAGALYVAVGLGHCRNRWAAGALGLLAAVVFHAGYFHADLVKQLGPGALERLDLLPRFIAFRMATDGVLADNQVLPRSEFLNWFYSAVELFVVALLTTVCAVHRTRRAYCESCGRWMRSILTQAEPGASEAIAAALQRGNLSAVPVVAARAATKPPAAWLQFEYCPAARAPGRECGAYLSLTEATSFKEHPKTLLHQGLLRPDELDALAARVTALAWLRVSAPQAHADEDLPNRPIARYAGAVAALQRLPPDAGGALVDRIVTKELFLALMPIAALVGGIALIVWGALGAPWADPSAWPRWLLLAVGVAAALAGAVVCWINVDYFGQRYGDRRMRALVAQRPDALVAADDPAARVVDVVPRMQWHQLPMDKAADRGLLLIDRSGRRLLFEGLKERYVIPAEAVLSATVEPVLPVNSFVNFFAIVLQVRYPAAAGASVAGGHRDDVWEIPLMPLPTEFRRWNTAFRRALAESICAEIAELPGRGSHPCTVRFQIEFDGVWTPVRELVARVDELLRYYLRQPRLSCCTMQAGFFIEVGAVPWNETVDEYRMAATWFAALVAILSGGQQEAFVWAWEESGAHIRRRGNLLELEDIHHSGQVVCPKMAVALGDFARQLLAEGRRWLELADMAARALAGPDYRAYPEEKKAVVLQNLAPPGLREDVSALQSALGGAGHAPNTDA